MTANYHMAMDIAVASDQVFNAQQTLRNYAGELPPTDKYEGMEQNAERLVRTAKEVVRLARTLRSSIARAKRTHERRLTRSLRDPYFVLRGEPVYAGDRVNGFVWTGVHKGTDRADLVEVEVVRVNPKTATVRYEDGHTQRIAPHHLNEKVKASDETRRKAGA